MRFHTCEGLRMLEIHTGTQDLAGIHGRRTITAAVQIARRMNPFRYSDSGNESLTG
jgi:hypothetical protein